MKIYREISILSSDNRHLRMDLYLPESDRICPVLVFFHGTRGFKDWGAWPYMHSHFNEQGIALITVSFSHNGTTAKNPEVFTDLDAYASNTISLELAEMKLVLDWIMENGPEYKLNVSDINICGHSRAGGEVIVFASGDKRVNRVITWASICDFTTPYKNTDIEAWKEKGFITGTNARTGQEMRMNYTFWEDYLKHKDEFNILRCASELDIPLLLIHGENDQSVPVSASEKLYSQCLHSLLVTIPGAGHTFGLSHPHKKDQPLPAHFREVLENTIGFILD